MTEEKMDICKTYYDVWIRKKGEIEWTKAFQHSDMNRAVEYARMCIAREACVDKVIRETIYRRP